MEIKTRNTLIGAGVGAVAGGAIAGAASIAKNKNINAQINEISQQLKSIDADTYVKEHCKAAKLKQFKAGIKPKKITKNLSKVIEKATADINTVKAKFSNEIKTLTKSRNKTVAIMIASGIAGGALIGAIVGRFIAKITKLQNNNNN